MDVKVVVLAAAVLGIAAGMLGGFMMALHYASSEIEIARKDARRERLRADIAVDALARQLRGEPISVAAVEAQEKALEDSLREREELQEMFREETDEPAHAPEEGA